MKARAHNACHTGTSVVRIEIRESCRQAEGANVQSGLNDQVRKYEQIRRRYSYEMSHGFCREKCQL